MSKVGKVDRVEFDFVASVYRAKVERAGDSRLSTNRRQSPKYGRQSPMSTLSPICGRYVAVLSTVDFVAVCTWLKSAASQCRGYRDRAGATVCHVLARYGHTRALSWLVETTGDECLAARTLRGATPLHYAATTGHLDTLCRIHYSHTHL